MKRKPKPDCYKCTYRREIPGDCHSQCVHPATGNNGADFLTSMVNAIRTANKAAGELRIVANPHGIRSGWFMWPANFDPVWLLSCDGFKAKAKVKP